jgi:hypothetical protein
MFMYNVWTKSKLYENNLVHCLVKVSIKILFAIAMIWLKIVHLSDISNIHLIYIL